MKCYSLVESAERIPPILPLRLHRVIWSETLV